MLAEELTFLQRQGYLTMVNPGSFLGSRKEFLIGEKPAYALAVRNGYTQDAIAKIIRRYLKRYPIDLPHNVEPSAEWLAAVDDNKADPEPEEPNKETLSASEYESAMEKLAERKALLTFRRMQIKRWMASQYMKDSNAPPKDPGSHNPYTALLKRLIGSNIARPRQKAARNLWRKPYKATIEAHLQAEIELGRRLNQPVSKNDYAQIRDRICRELYAELDEKIRRQWEQEAIKQHHEDLKEYNRLINADPSTDPEARQLAIQGVVEFMQPILDRVAAATGWNWSLFGGGPEPANGGRLSMISVHSGYTTGDVKMTFGRAEREGLKKHFIPMFGRFLRLCFSAEECQSRALTDEEACITLGSLEPDTDEATYHPIDTDNDSTADRPIVRNNTSDAAPGTATQTTGCNNAPNSIPDTNHTPNPAPASPPGCNIAPNPIPDTVPASPPMASDHAPIETTPTNGDGAGATDETAEGPSSPIINPFPFEECEDDRPLYLDAGATHGGSPPASPPVSRAPSPAPSQPLGVNPQPLPVIASSPVEAPTVASSPTMQLDPIPTSTDPASPAEVLPATSPPTMQPDLTPTSTDPVAVPQASRVVPFANPPTQSDTPTSVTTTVNSQASRKRKLKDVVDDPSPIVKPGSKRTRTKSMRALAAEEQQATRKKVERKVLPKDGVGGKENKVVSGKRVATTSKASRKNC